MNAILDIALWAMLIWPIQGDLSRSSFSYMVVLPGHIGSPLELLITFETIYTTNPTECRVLSVEYPSSVRRVPSSVHRVSTKWRQVSTSLEGHSTSVDVARRSLEGHSTVTRRHSEVTWRTLGRHSTVTRHSAFGGMGGVGGDQRQWESWTESQHQGLWHLGLWHSVKDIGYRMDFGMSFGEQPAKIKNSVKDIGWILGWVFDLDYNLWIGDKVGKIPRTICKNQRTYIQKKILDPLHALSKTSLETKINLYIFKNGTLYQVPKPRSYVALENFVAVTHR